MNGTYHEHYARATRFVADAIVRFWEQVNYGNPIGSSATPAKVHDPRAFGAIRGGFGRVIFSPHDRGFSHLTKPPSLTPVMRPSACSSFTTVTNSGYPPYDTIFLRPTRPRPVASRV
jgi:hypothetical protein